MPKHTEDSLAPVAPNLDHSFPAYEGSSLIERLKHLHKLLTHRFQTHDSHCQAYLQTGLQMFKADQALLLKLRLLQKTALLEAAIGTQVLKLSEIDQTEVWCAAPFEQKKTTFWNDSSGGKEILIYNDIYIRGYLTSPVMVAGQIYGVLCFLKTLSDQGPFTDEDVETIELMAKGVAKMIELQRVQPVDQERLMANFATDGMKTFEEFVQSARLPEVYGTPGRVVEVLQKRIGKASLAIEFIAEDMNLSKRTLQRRLQQQNISFAQLRDQVRFHYSISYLVENALSIDSISASLDFSDRTSFTNAFKRWTGLSPSTFRKLFRDYA